MKIADDLTLPATKREKKKNKNKMQQAISRQSARTNKSSGQRQRLLLEDLTSLLKATLETWAHQILYTRRVYPSFTFAPTTVWGIRCQACRSKEVVQYIHDSIDAGMTALCKGSASSLSLVIVDDDGDEQENFSEEQPPVEMERLTLFFRRIVQQVKDHQSLEQTERSMRDLILRTQSLPSRQGRGAVVITDTTSFRLVWHLESGDSNSYGELVNGFNNGTWTEDRTNQREGGLVRRPLYHASTALLQMDFYSQSRWAVKPKPAPRRSVVEIESPNNNNGNAKDDMIF